MGCCASIPGVPDEIIPDPTAPSTFFCKKSGTFSSNYSVYQGNEDGGLWLFIRKQGSIFKDNARYILENFVRDDPENPENGHALAVCKFDTLDAQAYKQYGFQTHEDSDDSDGYSEESDDDAEQKMKWTFKTKSKFYLDRGETQQVATMKVKAKGIAKRKVDFQTRQEEDGTKRTHAVIKQKKKIKKFIYKLEVNNQKVPIQLRGSLNKSNKKTRLDKSNVFCWHFRNLE